MKKPNYVAIDLGSAYTKFYISGQGIVYNEPSIIAYRINDRKIISVGEDAYKLVGKNNKNVKVVFPMIDGVITDIKLTQLQLEYIINKLRIDKVLSDAIFVMACPSLTTALEKQALEKIAHNLGSKFAIILDKAKLAAIGGGINIDAASGQLIIDSGGGTTDIAVITSGDIVISKSIKIAGNYLNSEIQKHIRSQHGLDVGIKTSEDVKKKIGSLSKTSDLKNLFVYGRDVVSGLPRQLSINPDEIREVLKIPFSRILDLAVQVLEGTPPELAGDIFRNGVTITGGTSLLKGASKYIAETLQLPARIGENPSLAVINGAKKFESKAWEIFKEYGKNESNFSE